MRMDKNEKYSLLLDYLNKPVVSLIRTMKKNVIGRVPAPVAVKHTYEYKRMNMMNYKNTHLLMKHNLPTKAQCGIKL